ncbi:extracellular serine rich protein [Aspergillus foveolatus]|uniref:extracellular serine rich protein n=1 Tax=Aspergillus foveolatus TaxID=210207 RepID=UPI003CCDB0AE
MHFPLQLSALTLLGSLTLTLAEQETDLGYLKCVSAVVRTTSFPSCDSSYKLDCFCEANAQLEAANAKENRNGLTSASANTAPRVELAPEVEELCAENGVPKEEITRYLCDDTAVPASPRRGSTPMIRMGQKKAEEAESESDCGSAHHTERDDEETASIRTSAAKRSISPGSTRLLIPENDSLEKEVAVDNDDDDDKEDKDDEDRMASTNAIYEVVTVTETRTECSCAKTATPVHGDEEDEENSIHMNMSGAMHGTQIAVAILPTPSQMSAAHAAQSDSASTSSVRVASSNDPFPTGVDAQQKHGGNEDVDAKMFEGTASGVVGVSRGVVLGLFGVAVGFVLL